MEQRHLHRAKLGRRLHDPVDGSLLVLRVRCGAAVSWCVATVATVATVLVVAVVVVVVVVTVDVVLVVVVAALSAAAGTAAVWMRCGAACFVGAVRWGGACLFCSCCAVLCGAVRCCAVGLACGGAGAVGTRGRGRGAPCGLRRERRTCRRCGSRTGPRPCTP